MPITQSTPQSPQPKGLGQLALGAVVISLALQGCATSGASSALSARDGISYGPAVSNSLSDARVSGHILYVGQSYSADPCSSSVDQSLVQAIDVSNHHSIWSTSQYGCPQSMDVDSLGNLWIAFPQNSVMEFSITHVDPIGGACLVGNPTALAFDKNVLYVANSASSSTTPNSGSVTEYKPGKCNPIRTLPPGPPFDMPGAIYVDKRGWVYVQNKGDGSIAVFKQRATTPTWTIANPPRYTSTLAVDSKGVVYTATSGANNAGPYAISEYALPKGKPASLVRKITKGIGSSVSAIAIDEADNLYVANGTASVSVGAAEIYAPSSMTPKAMISDTFEGQPAYATAIAVDSSGTVYLAIGEDVKAYRRLSTRKYSSGTVLVLGTVGAVTLFAH
jgi:sugar lactone lactonase YvrE